MWVNEIHNCLLGNSKNIFICIVVIAIISLSCCKHTGWTAVAELPGKEQMVFYSTDKKWVKINREFIRIVYEEPTYWNYDKYSDELEFLISIGDPEAIEAGIKILANVPIDGAFMMDDVREIAIPIYDSGDIFWGIIEKLGDEEKRKLIEIYDILEPVDWQSDRDKFKNR